MKIPLFLAGLVLCAAASSRQVGAVESVKLRCIADTAVSSYPSERGFNYGQSSHLRLKGIEMLALARFDMAPVRGWRVEEARLFLHASGEHRLKTLGLSTVATEWVEGDAAGKPGTGASFEWADTGKRRWGGRQSDVTDAIFTRQGTQAYYADLQPRESGWLEVRVPAELVRAMADGRSYGLAITDEKGQTSWNNNVHSREQSGFEPYLLVTGVPDPSIKPLATPTAIPQPAAVLPQSLTPVELPAAKPGDPPLHDGLRVWAYGECEKAHPISGNLLEEVGANRYAGAAAGDYRRRNAVWDGATSTVRLAAARNEFTAFQLCVEAASGKAAGVRVQAGDLVGPGGARIPGERLRVLQDWYVKDGEWYAEVARPLDAAFSLPDPRNGIPGQRNQSLLVELYVPHDAAPGLYHGSLNVSAEGVKPFAVPVELRVYGFTLPDTLAFAVDLNAYGPPGDAEMELRFQQMAHEHRATLNILGYSQAGRATEGYVPPLEGSGKSLHVKDWTEFDRRFGRYFDGSAFAGLPRASVPLRHTYLPFCEGWPSDIRQHYRYQPTTTEYPALIAEHALKAPPVQEAFDAQFQDEFRAMVKEFARHFREKGWNRTEFQFYLNDKYYYKDPKQGGRGSSWWLLDEPMHRDDWLALQFFGRMFKESVHEALGQPGPKDPQFRFRADISRPQWQRDWLDRLVDLMCVSGEFFRKNDLCLDLQRTQGIRFWHYATGNDINASNLTGEAWALRAYLAGADGILPWNSLGGDSSFDRPTPTTILYPGERFGIHGPLASLRLKAFRRGQQDVEYLALLAKQRGWSREQLAAAVAPLIDLNVKTREQFVDDAGTPLFERLSSDQFARIRASVAAALEKPGR